MALASAIDTATTTKPGWRARFAEAFNTYVESRSRVSQIHALHKLSDEELAKRGLTREAIPSYVFRDLFYV